MPILLLMAGGAMLAGGAGLMNEGRHQLALRQARAHREETIRALQDEVNISKLRADVREAGGDPDEALAALRALQAGKIDLADIEKFLTTQAGAF